MRNTILLISGGVVLSCLFAVWMYLLIFDAPENTQEVFADLGLGGAPTSPPPPATDTTPPAPATRDLVPRGTTQLTTTPVANARFIGGATTTEIYYAAAGTGHVYTIDLDSGEETRIHNATYPRITDATFAPDGSAVVLQSDRVGTPVAYLESLSGSGTTTPHSLPPAATNYTFQGADTLLYTVPSEEGLAIISYSLSARTTRTLATIPFTDIKLITAGGRVYFYNTPSPHYQGMFFEIQDGSFTPRTGAHYELAGMVNGTGTVVTRYDFDRESIVSAQGTTTLAAVAVPQKCAFSRANGNYLWCGAEVGAYEREELQSWRQGLETSRDMLFKINTRTGAAQVATDFVRSTGREVDVVKVHTHPTNEDSVLFVNKIDNTLWLHQAAE